MSSCSPALHKPVAKPLTTSAVRAGCMSSFPWGGTVNGLLPLTRSVYVPFAISICPMLFIPALFSSLIDSSHSSGFCGFLSRDFSRMLRALMSCLDFSSNLDSRSHSGMALGHFLIWGSKWQHAACWLQTGNHQHWGGWELWSFHTKWEKGSETTLEAHSLNL